jgi:dihydrolipoamide dehydrogenase
MKTYDVLVIGSGSGLNVAFDAASDGLDVALVDAGPMGGTCVNLGCVPSKRLIHPADVVSLIKNSGRLGISASIDSIDVKRILEEMRERREASKKYWGEEVKKRENITWFNGVGEFVSDYNLRAPDDVDTKAEKIFIASGSRPLIPPIKGLQEVECLTNETALELKELPESLTIIGGGFIAVEFAHFFSTMGTKVTMIEMVPRLVSHEEPEISEMLQKKMGENIAIHTNHQVKEVKEEKGMKKVVAENRENGQINDFSSEAILLATGRRSNSDLLKPEKTGVELDRRGWIKVNEFLETSKKNIWAFGDAIGKYQFTHVANYESKIAWHNANAKSEGEKIKVDYSSAPHAVFSRPQIGSVGLTEKQAREAGHQILVGKSPYSDVAKGAILKEEGFVKVIVEKNTKKLLGAHIVGPHAPILIQEITNVMNCRDGSFEPLTKAMHIHPALPEVVRSAFQNLKV